MNRLDRTKSPLRESNLGEQAEQEFPCGYDLFTQRLPLIEGLGKLLGRRVELIPEHELKRHIREQVLKEAVEL